MVIITFTMTIALFSLNLIKRNTAIFFLILPSAAYFSSKLKIEFLLFPLCAIRTDLGWRKEILVLLGIIAISNAIGENKPVCKYIMKKWIREGLVDKIEVNSCKSHLSDVWKLPPYCQSTKQDTFVYNIHQSHELYFMEQHKSFMVS